MSHFSREMFYPKSSCSRVRDFTYCEEEDLHTQQQGTCSDTHMFMYMLVAGKDGLDNINLFNIMTIMSFLILAPITILVEGVQVTPAVIQSLPEGMVTKAIIASVAFHSYQQISYLVLQRVSPVTHSIGNCIKRVVVIVASVIAFNIPVSRQNALGTALALFGVFLYSQAKRAENAKEKAT